MYQAFSLAIASAIVMAFATPQLWANADLTRFAEGASFVEISADGKFAITAHYLPNGASGRWRFWDLREDVPQEIQWGRSFHTRKFWPPEIRPALVSQEGARFVFWGFPSGSIKGPMMLYAWDAETNRIIAIEETGPTIEIRNPLLSSNGDFYFLNRGPNSNYQIGRFSFAAMEASVHEVSSEPTLFDVVIATHEEDRVIWLEAHRDGRRVLLDFSFTGSRSSPRKTEVPTRLAPWNRAVQPFGSLGVAYLSAAGELTIETLGEHNGSPLPGIVDFDVWEEEVLKEVVFAIRKRESGKTELLRIRTGSTDSPAGISWEAIQTVESPGSVRIVSKDPIRLLVGTPKGQVLVDSRGEKLLAPDKEDMRRFSKDGSSAAIERWGSSTVSVSTNGPDGTLERNTQFSDDWFRERSSSQEIVGVCRLGPGRVLLKTATEIHFLCFKGHYPGGFGKSESDIFHAVVTDMSVSKNCERVLLIEGQEGVSTP